jgi:hypothetical protein
LENEYIGLEFSNDTIRNPKVKQTTKKCWRCSERTFGCFSTHVLDRKSKLLYLKYLFIWKPNRTEPNRKKSSQTRKKPGQNRKTRAKPKNRAKPVWTSFCPKNRTKSKPVDLNRFRFFKKKSVWLLFFYQNWTEPKIITPSWIMLKFY